jgi:Legionella pneumophila major outer membrane protein precursor
MTFIKKNHALFASILLAMSANTSFAGTMGCAKGDVNLPCETTGWDIGIEALYLKSSHDPNANYMAFLRDGALLQDGRSSTTIDTIHKEIDYGWDWGYKLEGSYHFGAGNDITVNWTHFENTFTPIYDDSGLILIDFVPPNNPYIENTVNSHGKLKFDQVNAVLAQQIDVGANHHLRYFGGLQVVRYKQQSHTVHDSEFTLRTNPPGDSITTPTNAITRSNGGPQYTGAGIVIGSDYFHQITDGLEVVANLSGALTVGKRKFDELRNFVDTNPNGLRSRTVNVSVSNTALIPELEGRVGAKYSRAMTNGVASIEAGVKGLNYFNIRTVPIEPTLSYAPNNLLISLSRQGFPNTPTSYDASNFALYGPYVILKWLGNT